MSLNPGVVVILLVVTVLSGCAPASQQRNERGSGQDASNPAAPKILRVGMQNEPDNFLRPGPQGRERSLDFAHAQLTVIDNRGIVIPRLASEVPSFEKRTWKVEADGSMEVTWRLRPNARWQDGRQLTADDFLFLWEYLSDAKSVVAGPAWAPFVDRLVAADPTTLVVHFKQTYALANDVDLRPMPRHILGPAFAAGDMDGVNNSPHWRHEFVGAGPYRLVSWELGSRIEFTRFDDYFLGRPPLDGVIMSFFPNPNTLLANILAEEVDLHVPSGLEAPHAVELQRRWAGSANQVLVGSVGKVKLMAFQFRPGVAVTPSALRERAVRQALYRVLDRDAASEAVTHGLGPIADSWVPPDDPRRQIATFRDSIIQYPYDLDRGRRELAAAGWQPGPDGILVNGAGERFQFEMRDTGDDYLNVLADAYKKAGIGVIQTVIPAQQGSDREYRSLHPGVELTSNTYTEYDKVRLHSSDVAAPGNRYAGGNKGGFTNPEMDRLLDRLAQTVPPADRTAIQADILNLALAELPVLPIHWSINVMTATARVKNLHIPTPLAVETWNLPEWDMAT